MRAVVVAVDCLLPESYGGRQALQPCHGRQPSGVRFVEADLRTDDLAPILVGCDAVINGGGDARTRQILGRLPSPCVVQSARGGPLDPRIARGRIGRFVQISTSSVYGRYAVGDESSPTSPSEPVRVGKLAAETGVGHVANWFPCRGFAVLLLYGPRQRPDMGYHLFCEAMLDGRRSPSSVMGIRPGQHPRTRCGRSYDRGA